MELIAMTVASVSFPAVLGFSILVSLMRYDVEGRDRAEKVRSRRRVRRNMVQLAENVRRGVGR